MMAKKKKGGKKKVLHKKKHVVPEITLWKLVKYNLMFFVPLLLLIVLSYFVAGKTYRMLEVQPSVVAMIFTSFASLLIFFYIVPHIRNHEKLDGIRYSILAFAIVGLGLTFPSALKGNYDLLLNLPIFIANYFFITFIFSPEVLGMAKDIRLWFRHNRQFILIMVHLTIVAMYIMGFAYMYYRVDRDSLGGPAFQFSNDNNPSFPTYIYYSTVTFSTVGYGDIVPVSPAARLVFGIEAILGMVVNVVFIAILLMFISGVRGKGEEELEKVEKQIEKEEGILAGLFGGKKK